MTSLEVSLIDGKRFHNLYAKKLERFLPKNQHTQRKFLNFENFQKNRVLKINYFHPPIHPTNK